MADPNPQHTSESRGSNRNRGNRQRGGRGGISSANTDRSQQQQQQQQQQQKQRRGNRGAGRGRGGSRNERRDGQSTTDGAGHEPPGPNYRGIGTSGGRLTGDAMSAQGEEGKGATTRGANRSATDDETTDDNELCFICASKVDHLSVAPCNHRTCHICSLRMRALYKTKACAHCRAESSFVIFTNDGTKSYEELADSRFARVDDNLGIKYDSLDIFEDTVLLLRYNCPDEDCDTACLGWPDLHRHVKSKHGKIMCDLCTRNKKVFTHEHELFSAAELRKHERHGDDSPGAIDQSGFKGHPECGFCRQRFYGDDELYTHCRDKHERCHICDRTSSGRNHQYYVNYDSLEEHFGKDHFLCLDKECLEKKFVVFESQMDLKAHQLESHPSGLSKDVRRDARLVDMSTFDYRAPYQNQRPRREPREGREGRGAGRGRDPATEPIPASSAQPLRRDELAYQRHMAIQSAQSVSQRTFGGQLTPSEPPRPTARPPVSAGISQQPPPSRPATNSPVPAMESLEIGSSPQEQARGMAHTAVMDRASSLLRNDTLKINDFRSKVSAFRTSKISASELIESFFSLFDTSPAELGKLVKELAHIYEDESKCTNLLKAWNDWRAINEDYPALPGPSGSTPFSLNSSMTGTPGGKRVLRLKSSTAKSSRSAMGKNASIPGTNASSNPFPPLAGTSNSKSKGKRATPWATTTSTTSSPGSSSPIPSRSASRTPQPPLSRAGVSRGSDAFPALPSAPKPNTLMAGLTRGTVRWDDRSGAASSGPVWSGDPTPAESNLGGLSGQDKKGKGKKGKQVLYHFG